MELWLISFELENGFIGDTTVYAVNRVMAYELFNQIVQEQNWKVKYAEANRIIEEEEDNE